MKVNENLEELFRRIAFNVAVSNCDDHLRNHGFLYSTNGWTLSPAFDLTPNPAGYGLKLNINETDNALDYSLVLSIAPYLGLEPETANRIVSQVRTAVSLWRKVATRFGISRSEQDTMENAFKP